jgi:hypothetical protein
MKSGTKEREDILEECLACHASSQLLVHVFLGERDFRFMSDFAIARSPSLFVASLSHGHAMSWHPGISSVL